MNNNLVSVVIPTYNQTQNLKKALTSVINQTYKFLEIIIIDDNVEEKISKFVSNLVDDNRKNNNFISLKYIKNKENSGSVFSRNEGIRISNGTYITFLDDDDIFTNDKIERQLQRIINTNSDFSVCNIALTKDWKTFKIRERKYLKNKESLLTLHQKYHMAGTSTFMFRRESLIKLGGFTSQDFGDDYYLIEQSIINSLKFVHANFVGVYAWVDNSVGLSSWSNKIKTEKALFNHKMNNFKSLSKKDIRYIKMRHNLVLAKAYLDGRRILKSILLFLASFLQHPFGFIRIGLGLDV